MTSRETGVIEEELRDLKKYINGLPKRLVESGAFVAYQNREKLLQNELVASQSEAAAAALPAQEMRAPAKDLIKQIETFRDSKTNYESFDGLLYNGGVILTFVCTGAATVLAAAKIQQEYLWVVSLLSRVATIYLAIDHILQFNRRWNRSRSVNAAIEALILRLETIDTLPEAERPAELKSVRIALLKLPGKYRTIPANGGLTQKELGRRLIEHDSRPANK
jgi:hypothetical protein